MEVQIKWILHYYVKHGYEQTQGNLLTYQAITT